MKLSEVCLNIVDCPHSTAPDEGSGYALVRTPNIGKGRFNLEGVHRISEAAYKKRCTRITPTVNDLILAREAPAGNVAIIKENMEPLALGQRTVLIRPNPEKVCPDFLVYYLLAPQQQNELLGRATGATVAHVNIPIINNLPVSLPPLETQKKIAGILSAYDDLIENNRKQIKLLEEAAQKLYKEWFVKLNFPGHENVKIVDGLPEGWKKVSVTDILEIKYGKDYKLLNNGNFPVYGTGGIMRYVNKYLHSGESVLIPRKGSLNNIMLVNESFWTLDTMFYSIPKIENTAKIVYFYLKNKDMYSMNIGAAVPSMTVNALSGMQLLLPDENLRLLFEQQISPYFDKIFNSQLSILNLQSARDRLLPRLMNGEIEV